MRARCNIKNPIKRFFYYLKYIKEFKIINKFLKENEINLLEGFKKRVFDMLNGD
jgi:hypothetical protein